MMDDYDKCNELVIELVLPFLDFSSIINFSSTSTNHYRVINSDNLLWKGLCQQQNISSEQWDWQDKENWLLDTPCKWKRIFMNYKRTAFNMRNNKFNKYEIQESFANFDGKTLIFQTHTKLSIFKVDEERLEFFQNIELPTRSYMSNAQTKTNTDYVVVACDGYAVLYRLINNCYSFYYKLGYNNDMVVINDFNARCNFDTMLDRYNLVKNNLIITSGRGKFFIWNILEKKLLFTDNYHEYLDNDNNNIYIKNCNNETIISFNENINFRINIEFPIYNFFIVENSLFIWNKGSNGKCWVSRWDKLTGERLQESKQLSIDYDHSVLAVLYHSCDVYLVLSPSFELTAYNSLNNIKMWGINIKTKLSRRYNSVQWHADIYNIFNTLSIVMIPYDNKIRELEYYKERFTFPDKNIITFYNIKNGSILNSFNIDCGSSVYVYNGIIITSLRFLVTATGFATTSSNSSVYMYR